MCRNILPKGAALMYTLDEMSVLSMRIFLNSLTYQANKLLEKVIVNLCRSCLDSWTLDVDKIILWCDYTIFPFPLVQLVAGCIIEDDAGTFGLKLSFWVMDLWMLDLWVLSKT